MIEKAVIFGCMILVCVIFAFSNLVTENNRRCIGVWLVMGMVFACLALGELMQVLR